MLTITIPAMELFNESFQIGARRLTVSTSGIIPQIRKLADLDMQSTLALSLHASNHETRKKLMQIENKYPMEELHKALKYYVEKTYPQCKKTPIKLATLGNSAGIYGAAKLVIE